MLIDTGVSAVVVMVAVMAVSLARRISTEELAVEFLERSARPNFTLLMRGCGVSTRTIFRPESWPFCEALDEPLRLGDAGLVGAVQRCRFRQRGVVAWFVCLACLLDRPELGRRRYVVGIEGGRRTTRPYGSSVASSPVTMRCAARPGRGAAVMVWAPWRRRCRAWRLRRSVAAVPEGVCVQVRLPAFLGDGRRGSGTGVAERRILLFATMDTALPAGPQDDDWRPRGA